MNRQGEGKIEWCDYTWNPIGGCFHDCKWEMPDGTIAQCYAKTIAEKFNAGYPQGFEHHYFRPEKLSEPLKHKEPSRIFLDSMSDIAGHWVVRDQARQVMDYCGLAHWHTFQLLTKNVPGLLKLGKIPPNVWVGASVPPTFYMGKRLTFDQQLRMLATTLRLLKQIDVPIRWMSIEPLSFDIAPHMADCGLQWVVIGAASNGRKYYQPERAWVQNLLDTMDAQGIPVFFKGNLDWQPWRAFFPGEKAIPAPVLQQMALFD